MKQDDILDIIADSEAPFTNVGVVYALLYACAQRLLGDRRFELRLRIY